MKCRTHSAAGRRQSAFDPEPYDQNDRERPEHPVAHGFKNGCILRHELGHKREHLGDQTGIRHDVLLYGMCQARMASVVPATCASITALPSAMNRMWF